MPKDQIAEAIVSIREQWGPVIRDVIAASTGDAHAPRAERLEPFLSAMSQRDDWRALVAVLRRILAGERDPMRLLSGLDDTDLIIAGDVLRGLGTSSLPPIPGEPSEEGRWQGDEGHGDDGHSDDGDMVSLDEFLAMVVRACSPDAPPSLAGQLAEATRGMAAQPDAPSGIRELGRVLNAVLLGEREFDLSALPPQLADKVRGVLEALK